MNRILLPAKLVNLEKLLDFIKEATEKHGLNSKNVRQILLASEEAIVNVINYAYPEKMGDIEITHDVMDNGKLVIEIIDWGVPFDPTLIKEPDINASLEDRKVGGLGIYMIRRIMDEVTYKREGNRNILKLIKERNKT